MIEHAMVFIAGAALSFGLTQLWAWETRRMQRNAKRDELTDARATLEAKFNAWMDSHADQTYAEILEELYKYSRHSREITSEVIRTLLAEGVAAGTLAVRQEPMSGLGLTMAYHVYRRRRPQELLQVMRPRIVAHMEATRSADRSGGGRRPGG